MGRIKIGSRVSTEAWRFDQNCEKESDRWSFKHFGVDWRDARAFGVVVGRSSQKFLIKWDIDGDETGFETESLHKEPDVGSNKETLTGMFFSFYALFQSYFKETNT